MIDWSSFVDKLLVSDWWGPLHVDESLFKRSNWVGGAINTKYGFNLAPEKLKYDV